MLAAQPAAAQQPQPRGQRLHAAALTQHADVLQAHGPRGGGGGGGGGGRTQRRRQASERSAGSAASDHSGHSGRGHREDGSVCAPWYPHGEARRDVTLSRELRDFAGFMALTQEERQVRDTLIATVSGIAQGLWPGCCVSVYGSYAHGLSSPASAVDVVVEGVDDGARSEAAFAAVGCVRSAMLTPGSGDGFLQLEAPGGAVANVSLHPAVGGSGLTNALPVVKAWLAEFPSAACVLAAVRHVLAQACGDCIDVCRGGLSPFALLVMVIHVCRRQGAGAGDAPAELLLAFLQYYGKDFAYAERTATPLAAEALPRADEHTGDEVSVADPIDPANNLAAGCTRLRQIRAHLQSCLIALRRWETEPDAQERTPLSMIVSHQPLWQRGQDRRHRTAAADRRKRGDDDAASAHSAGSRGSNQGSNRGSARGKRRDSPPGADSRGGSAAGSAGSQPRRKGGGATAQPSMPGYVPVLYVPVAGTGNEPAQYVPVAVLPQQGAPTATMPTAGGGRQNSITPPPPSQLREMGGGAPGRGARQGRREDSIPPSAVQSTPTHTMQSGRSRERQSSGSNTEGHSSLQSALSARGDDGSGCDSGSDTDKPSPPASVSSAGRKSGASSWRAKEEADPAPYMCTVAFRYGRSGDFAAPTPLSPGVRCVVETGRGHDLGTVTSCGPAQPPPPPEQQQLGQGLRGRVVRSATASELADWAPVAREEAEALRYMQDLAAQHQVLITVHAAEYQFDRRKLTFHYSSPLPRPPFQALLHDGYRRFRCRIWMNNCVPRDGEPGEAIDVSHFADPAAPPPQPGALWGGLQPPVAPTSPELRAHAAEWEEEHDKLLKDLTAPRKPDGPEPEVILCADDADDGAPQLLCDPNTPPLAHPRVPLHPAGSFDTPPPSLPTEEGHLGAADEQPEATL